MARHIDAGPAEFRAMDHLHATGELTPGQLCDRLALTSGAVTGLIDRLVSHGWVERVPHATDRRSVVIRPASRSGEAPKLYAAYGKRLMEAAERLSDEDSRGCRAFLDEAAEAARATADELRGSTESSL